MKLVSGNPADDAKQNGGQLSTGADSSVRRVIPLDSGRLRFRELAKFAWPDKTDVFLSHCTGYDARTCRRWLAEDTDPPAEALSQALAEIMRRFHMR